MPSARRACARSRATRYRRARAGATLAARAPRPRVSLSRSRPAGASLQRDGPVTNDRRFDSTLAPELIAAYQAAHYRVSGATPPFDLVLDVPNAALAACHRRYGVDCSALLTAWNPHSVRVPPADNALAAARLEQRLQALGLRWLAGFGADAAGAWEAEPSLLVFGLGRDAACAIGRDFGQAGLVHAGGDAVPRLVLLA